MFFAINKYSRTLTPIKQTHNNEKIIILNWLDSAQGYVLFVWLNKNQPNESDIGTTGQENVLFQLSSGFELKSLWYLGKANSEPQIWYFPLFLFIHFFLLRRCPYYNDNNYLNKEKYPEANKRRRNADYVLTYTHNHTCFSVQWQTCHY